MTDLVIPDHVLASAKAFLEKETFFFKGYVSAVFKPMLMAWNEFGCYCVITMPNGDERFFDSYSSVNNNVHHRVPISIKEGKKRIPYSIDLNAINSSIKLNHKNLYRNNLWFQFIDNNLDKIILNQSVVPNGSDEIAYLLYSAELSNQFNLNASNSASFYIFNHLMNNTPLKDILPENDYFSQFKYFSQNDSAHVELLKMYVI
jgi:hypothetical protein